MTTAVSTVTVAATQAARNWAANLRALAASQPGFADRVQSIAVVGEWVFARDGALSLQSTPGQWLGGCSLPYRAGSAMMQTLDPRGTTLCFLAPLHAGEVRAALDRTTAQQCVLAVQPDTFATRVLLSCDDFSGDIDAHRLLFVTGDTWPDDLRRIFNDRPGLPTPQQFIKLPTLTADIADPIIQGCQGIFAAVNAERTERIVALKNTPRSFGNTGTIAVIGGSKFALWEDAGAQLATALLPGDTVNLHRLDPDCPLLAGPLAVAEFCSKAAAVVIADVGRSDYPEVLNKDLPWVTWVTRGRIPAASGAGPRDGLLVADAAWRDAAIAAGWPAQRVDVAGFPPIAAGESETTFDGWTILADTRPVQQPKQLDEFSSHKLLWEAIAAELAANPFALDDAGSYLHKQCRAIGIDEATLDRKLFVEQLMLPAYVQGVARALRKAGVPLRAFGHGWGQIDEFVAIAAGPIYDRAGLSQALAASRKLVHVWPGTGAHPIFATGLPVLRRRVSLLDAFVREARSGAVPAMQTSVPAVSMGRVLRMLET